MKLAAEISEGLATLGGGEIRWVPPEKKWTVLCFLGTECPLAKLYGPRLQKLANEFSDSVQFVGVFSNRHDSVDDILRYVERVEIAFPAVRDEANRLADACAATRTPEVLVVSSERHVAYRGRIDDQYEPGVSRTSPETHDLKVALTQLVDGTAVSVPQTIPQGCLIGRIREVDEAATVTYCNQISRILNRHCVECHRAGEIGPFALDDYDEVIGWGEMIREVIDEKRMPPWHASPESVAMKNARSMTESEKRMVRDWVDAGGPYGRASDLPEKPEFTSGWQLPKKPDVVLPMRDRPFTIPADGTVEYQYYVVDPGFDEDRWVLSAQAVPGNSAVVHHIIVFVRPPDGSRFRGVGWVTAYVPGQRVPAPIPGHARKIPAGSKLVFQMHYTPNGREQTDLSKVGLVFARESEVTHEVYTSIGIDQEFEIPPNAADYRVNGRAGYYPRHGKLLSIVPHMHVRGKAFRMWAADGDGRRLLLDVPRYDFNWQHAYLLNEPMELRDVESLDFEAAFDNSSGNPVNPDPSQFVTWGDQTWEEMAVVFFEVAEPLHNDSTPQVKVDAEEPQVDPTRERVRHDASQFARRFVSKFDKDGDGHVRYSETPLVFRRFAFWRYDNNGDRSLGLEEIEEYAIERFAEKLDDDS